LVPSTTRSLLSNPGPEAEVVTFNLARVPAQDHPVEAVQAELALEELALEELALEELDLVELDLVDLAQLELVLLLNGDNVVELVGLAQQLAPPHTLASTSTHTTANASRSMTTNY
jgi:hypothetical protein